MRRASRVTRLTAETNNTLSFLLSFLSKGRQHLKNEYLATEANQIQEKVTEYGLAEYNIESGPTLTSLEKWINLILNKGSANHGEVEAKFMADNENKKDVIEKLKTLGNTQTGYEALTSHLRGTKEVLDFMTDKKEKSLDMLKKYKAYEETRMETTTIQTDLELGETSKENGIQVDKKH